MIQLSILNMVILVLVFGLVGYTQDSAMDIVRDYVFNNQPAPDPGIPDTIRVETISVPNTESAFNVDVFMYNDEELGGLSIPLVWDSPDFDLDTVLFDGSRVENVVTKPVMIDNVNRRVLVGVIIFFEEYIQPGSGLLFTMHFAAAPGATDQVFSIDSSFYPPAGMFTLVLSTGINIYPRFVPGEITYGDPVLDPVIDLSPPSFAVAAVQGGANPDPRQLTITNTGHGVLSWTASSSADWLSLSPVSGVGNGSVTVSIDITDLPFAMYHDTITVSDPGASNSPQKAPIDLWVQEPFPIIGLDPDELFFDILLGDSGLAPKSVSITNLGGRYLRWTIEETEDWLSVNPMSGTEDGTIWVSVDTSGIGHETWFGSISVIDTFAVNSPQTIDVWLERTSADTGGSGPPSRNIYIFPEIQHFLMAYSLVPKSDTIIFGDLDCCRIADIDPATVVVNDSIVPTSVTVLPSSPYIDGEAMQLVIPARDFILSYGLLYDTAIYSFEVSGFTGDQEPFAIADAVILIGLLVGDVDGNGAINVGDATGIIDYIFRDGTFVVPVEAGDVNGDGGINIGDALYLIDYIFRDGPKPIEP